MSMNKKEISQFIRNNYFKGKQLTVRDFCDEQEYQQSKLKAMRLANYGCGVVSGMDVVCIDSTTVSVEAGYAYDAFGNDILVSSPVLKDVTSVDGFDNINTDFATYLCIEYKETMTEQVSPLADSLMTCYNRTAEGYHLYLTNHKPEALACGMLPIIETTKELVCQPNLTVKVTVPKFVNVNEKLIISVEIEKRNLNGSLSCELELTHGAFFNNREIFTEISYYNATDKFNIQKEEIILTPSGKMVGLNKISIPADSIDISIGDEQLVMSNGLDFTVEIIDEPVEKRVLREYFHEAAGMDIDPSKADALYLAEIRFSDNNGILNIENISPLPYKQYIMGSRLSYLLDNLPKQPVYQLSAATDRVNESVSTLRQEEDDLISSGVENIDITVDYKGKVYYSAEIIHGLGEGEIAYTIGVEPVNSSSVGTDNTVLFGSPDLFEGSPYAMEFPKIQYSVISYNDKGTFRIAVKLLDKLHSGNIRIHWQATKKKTENEKVIMEIDKMSISIQPNLVNIEPRGTIGLECIIEGCDNLNCIWKVEDKNGGTISQNGLYKAPSAEGVYTVTATSVKYPTRKAVNYIIVSRKRDI